MFFIVTEADLNLKLSGLNQNEFKLSRTSKVILCHESMNHYKGSTTNTKPLKYI